MEIEIGDFVRTEKGKIFKYGKGRTYLGKNNKIVNHSKDITDLIEDDDIVIVEYYVARFRERISRMFECTLYKGEDGEYIIFENKHCDWWYNKTKKEWVESKGFNPKIKSIVTKEAYRNIEYRLE